MSPALTDSVVDGARRGDADALTTVYTTVAPGVLAYLRSRGSRDPEGLTQEVFLQLIPRLSTITGGGAGVRALAFTIAHSRLVDEFRRRSRAVELPFESELDARRRESAESEALGQGGIGDIAQRLSVLGDEQRAVILLRVLGDLSLAETAAVLGKSVGAVKQLQRRALLALRSHAEEWEELS